MKPNQLFTKIPDNLAEELEAGNLTLMEYGLLVFMIQKADKHTGILVTNSRSLSYEVDIDRTRVRNLIAALKRKGRFRRQDGDKSEASQRRGSTKPYPIGLHDHIPMPPQVRDKSEISQTQVRDPSFSSQSEVRAFSEKARRPAETLGKTENGKNLALRSRSKDKDLSSRTTYVYSKRGDEEETEKAEIIPYQNEPEPEQLSDLSMEQRMAVDDWAARSINRVNRMYYTRSSDDTVRLFKLLRLHPPSKILSMAERAQDMRIDDALDWMERGMPDA